MNVSEAITAPAHAVGEETTIAKASCDMRSAQAFFLTNLARIAGDASITAGDDEFDYFVPVPASRLHDMGLRVSQLQLEVQERFGVVLTAMPIPFAD